MPHRASQDPQRKALAERVGAAFSERDSASRLLGIGLDEIRPGYARLSMTVRGDMLNGVGICHGGITYTLADTAFAYACNAANEVTVAAGCSITFPAPAKLGDVLTAECREVHKRGRSGVYDVTVTNQDGTVVGLFRGQSARLAGTVIPVSGASHA